MSLKLPPGPDNGFLGLVAIGEIKRDLLGYYQRLQREFGDIVYMRLGPYRDFTFFHPDQIRELLVEKAKYFVRMPRPIQVLRQWNGDGILITEGETWQRHRRILQPAFSPKRIAGYAKAMVAAIDDALDRLPSEPTTVDIEEVVNDLTTASICRTMFGTDLGPERRDVRMAVKILSKTAVDEMFAPFTWPDWLPFKSKRQKRWAIERLDTTVRGFVRSCRDSSGNRDDLISRLLASVDEDGNGAGLTDEQVRDHSMTIFLAGHDTTAAGLVWVCWALAAHTEVQTKVAEEARRILGDSQPTFDRLPELVYIGAVVKETLRHWPPAVAVFARQALQDVEIGGYTIPKGASARVFLYVTQHDARWFPDPNHFKPERWLGDRASTIPGHAYLPFGAGPRACIGKEFAITEMILATAMLMRRFEVSCAPGQQQPAMDPSMSLRPVGGMRLQIRPR